MKLDKDLQARWDELFEQCPILTFKEWYSGVPTRRYMLEREQQKLIEEQEKRDRLANKNNVCNSTLTTNRKRLSTTRSIKPCGIRKTDEG